MTRQQTAGIRPAGVPALLVAASTYLLLGLAGLALAIPPGYASPIFPAAGFAAAIMLWSSRRAWPAIALGSLLLNLIAGDLTEAARTSTLMTALGIATGATVQAYITAVLVQRIAGQGWRTMEFAGDIVRVLVLAGPVGCVVSASIGVGTLYFNGLTPPSDILFTWWNWWAGDTLGVLVGLPLSLAWLLRSDTPWRKRPLALGLPMLVTLAVIAAGYFAVSRWERTEQDMAVRRHGEQLARLLEQRFIAHQEALAALKRLIEVSPDMSYAQFDRFTQITLRDNPDIFALSFNPYVRQADRALIERRMARATGKADFEIKERDAQKRLVRAADRADYVAVGYIAPLKGNLPAIGYDINSEPVRQDAIRRARESRRPAVTATIQLVQENQKRVGALLLHPAYAVAQDGDGVPGDANLLGFAVGVIKLDQMVQIATDAARVYGLAFEIDDITERPHGKVFRSDGEAAPRHPASIWRVPLAMADRTWELAVYPTAAYQPENRPWIAWATGVVGLLLAALFQILLLVTTGHAAATERKVKRQSEELETQGAELQVRNALINTLFDVSPDGFIALASDGTVRLSNPAFHRLSGIPVDEIVGRPLAELDRRLRLGAEQPERYISLDALFADPGEVSPKRRLVLARPHEVVLQIVGVRSAAAGIDRFAYFRDVTHEAEVDRMKSEFLSHAAHELRTPMASIYGFTELLMTQTFDEATRQDLLATIHKQTEWLVDIINELLDLARIESRRGKDFRIEVLSLPPLMHEALSAMQIDASRWPLAIGAAPDRPAILADAAKLRQALTNVLGNAVKYSPLGGSIEIHYATRDAGGRTFVGVSVTDHGIGMRQDQVARVCDRFYRADTSGKIPGTGLGMSIVKEIVELLGGNVEIVSAPGVGTSVTLWLPAALADEAGTAAGR